MSLLDPNHVHAAMLAVFRACIWLGLVIVLFAPLEYFFSVSQPR